MRIGGIVGAARNATPPGFARLPGMKQNCCDCPDLHPEKKRE